MVNTALNRVERVAQSLQEGLGKILVEGLRDPRVGFVTVTEVRCSKDLRSALVFVSVYGSNEARSETLEGLTAAAGFLKRELSHQLNLRFVPNLKFVLDTTLDKAVRIETLMQAIESGETEIPEMHVYQPVEVHVDRMQKVENPRHKTKKRKNNSRTTKRK